MEDRAASLMGTVYLPLPRLDNAASNAKIGAMRGLHLPAGERRTFWGIAGDMFFFGIGASLSSQTTVVPSFLATLTTSAPLIGLASTIATGGWLVPQLFAANRLAGLTRRKAAVTIPAAVNRSVALLVGPAMFLLAPRVPGAALAVFFVLYLAFWLVDGIASVAWLDYLGRCLSPASRARLISLGTIAPGVVGIGAGAAVGFILSDITWPLNYSLLFMGSGVLFSLSLISFLFVKDPPVAAVQPRMPWPAYFRRMVTVMKGDPAFRQAVLAAIGLAGIGVAAPFYIVHGLESLGFPPASVGLFTSVQLVGSVFAALILGLVAERRGTRAVMRLCGGAAVLTPGIALAAPTLSVLLPAAVMYVYALVFVIVGMQGVANMAGFLNWVLEYSPASDRPLYIGFANTLTGVSLVMPLIGGWLLAISGSYTLLFAVAAVGPVCGLLLLRTLPEPRRRAESTRA
jgi:MFS family permease